GCSGCDGAVRELTGLRESLEQLRVDADALDLGGAGTAGGRAAGRGAARGAWARRVRMAPAWGLGLAAASALFWLRTPAPAPTRRAARPRPNQAVIERIDSGAARLELRRERKYGTTLIMVNAAAATP